MPFSETGAPVTRVCRCSSPLPSNCRPDRKWCSESCRVRHWERANPERAKSIRRKNEQRRRARKLEATIEDFSDLEIFERDGWVCGICGDPIDPELRYPDPHSVSLDHIVSLSKGGDHSRANTQAAHLICNARKSNKDIY